MSNEDSDCNYNITGSYTWISSKIDVISSSDENIIESNASSSSSTLTHAIDELVLMNTKYDRASVMLMPSVIMMVIATVVETTVELL